MTLEEIWKWRCESLRFPTGGWRANAVEKIILKMDQCDPPLWLGSNDVSEVKELSKCYQALVRIAGGILNEKPDLDQAERLLNEVRGDYKGFQIIQKSKKNLSIFEEDLEKLAGECLSLAIDTAKRMKNIGSLGGF